MAKFRKINSKGNNDKVVAHVKEYMDEEDIKLYIKEFKYNYEIAKTMYEHGSLLVYNYDVIDFLESLELNPEAYGLEPYENYIRLIAYHMHGIKKAVK